MTCKLSDWHLHFIVHCAYYLYLIGQMVSACFLRFSFHSNTYKLSIKFGPNMIICWRIFTFVSFWCVVLGKILSVCPKLSSIDILLNHVSVKLWFVFACSLFQCTADCISFSVFLFICCINISFWTYLLLNL